nr:hypothetical protein [Gammaproteobacteria bacterium]
MLFDRRRLWWVLGVAVALIGVAIARILGPQLPPAYQPSVFVAGAAIAVLGVFVAALGAGRVRTSKAPDA